MKHSIQDYQGWWVQDEKKRQPISKTFDNLVDAEKAHAELVEANPHAKLREFIGVIFH